jgi:tetratricopeptide (TPR) repeat protein
VHGLDSWLKVQDAAGSKLEALTTAGVVEIPVLVSTSVYRGLLFELYVNGITFLDNFKNPIVMLEEVLASSDDSVEKKALVAMVEAGNEVVEFTTGMKEQISHGKWQGTGIAAIMYESTPNDYRAFLRFVRDYPGKYIGKSWKISEAYATWLINDAPLSNQDTLIELATLDGKAGFSERVAVLPENNAAALFEMLSSEIDALPAKNYAAGKRRFNLMEHMLLARKAPSALLQAEVEHARANLLALDPTRRHKAAIAYARAATLYGEVPTTQNPTAPLSRIICLNNEAKTYYDMQQPDEVMLRIPTIRALADALRRSPPDAEIGMHAQLSDAYIIMLGARIASERGDYRQVVDELTPQLDRYAAVAVPGFRQQEIDLIKLLALAHQKLGETDRAVELLERAEGRAREQGDALGQTGIAWQIGALHYAASRYAEALEDSLRTAQLAREAGDQAWEGKALAAAGQALWSLGKPQEALAQHALAMQLREAVGNDSSIAWQLLQVGKIHLELGEQSTAKRDFERALALHVKLGEKKEEANIHLQLGGVFAAMEQFGDAKKEYAAARTIFRKLKMAPDEARAMLNAADVLAQQRHFTQAVQLAARAATIADRIGDRELKMRTRLIRWGWLRSLNQRAKAGTMLNEALAAAGDEAMLRIDVLLALVAQRRDSGDLTGARKASDEALKLAGNNEASRQSALLARADILEADGEYEESIKVYDQIIAHLNEGETSSLLAQVWQSKSWQLARLGRLQEARSAAESSLAIAKLNRDSVAQAWAMNTLAEVAGFLGDLREQLRIYDAAISLMRLSKNRFGEAVLTFNRAQVSIQLRDFDEVLSGIDAAERLLGDDENFDFRLQATLARGEALVLTERYDEGDTMLIAALEQARKSLPELVPEILSTRGKLLVRRGDFTKALSVLEEAVQIEEQRNGAAFVELGELGVAQARAGKSEAEATLLTAIARAEKSGAFLSWEVFYQLGRIQSDAQHNDEAIKTLLCAAHNIEIVAPVLKTEADKSRYWGDKADVYTLLVRLLSGQEKGHVL